MSLKLVLSGLSVGMFISCLMWVYFRFYVFRRSSFRGKALAYLNGLAVFSSAVIAVYLSNFFYRVFGITSRDIESDYDFLWVVPLMATCLFLIVGLKKKQKDDGIKTDNAKLR